MPARIADGSNFIPAQETLASVNAFGAGAKRAEIDDRARRASSGSPPGKQIQGCCFDHGLKCLVLAELITAKDNVFAVLQADSQLMKYRPVAIMLILAPARVPQGFDLIPSANHDVPSAHHNQ